MIKLEWGWVVRKGLRLDGDQSRVGLGWGWVVVRDKGRRMKRGNVRLGKERNK